jgi:uncharacterized protein (TIGR02757 family)
LRRKTTEKKIKFKKLTLEGIHLEGLKELLDQAVVLYNQPLFIGSDPIQIPHRFSKKQDIEIAGLIAALFAWGQRKTIIQKSSDFLELMDNQPYAFIRGYSSNELRRFEKFVHRTFNSTDSLFLIDVLRRIYTKYDSLEHVFFPNGYKASVAEGIVRFHHFAFNSAYAPERSRKHFASPDRGSTCKRLNMYLRWMVRSDEQGVDFGLWKKLNTSDLRIPLDVHVEKVARNLGLLQRKNRDWQAVEELTSVLRMLDPLDPVKYDFALFGMGVLENKKD